VPSSGGAQVDSSIPMTPRRTQAAFLRPNSARGSPEQPMTPRRMALATAGAPGQGAPMTPRRTQAAFLGEIRSPYAGVAASSASPLSQSAAARKLAKGKQAAEESSSSSSSDSEDESSSTRAARRVRRWRHHPVPETPFLLFLPARRKNFARWRSESRKPSTLSL
jgi:hypothetical protein